jgi:hypothetical protein
MPTTYDSTEQRVEQAALAYLETAGQLPSAFDLAMALTEEDVVNGEYEGCSPELDLAASDYIAAAERVL